MGRPVVGGQDEQPENRVVVSAAVGLAPALGLKLAAQGVEATEETDEVRLMGSDVVQGH